MSIKEIKRDLKQEKGPTTTSTYVAKSAMKEANQDEKRKKAVSFNLSPLNESVVEERTSELRGEKKAKANETNTKVKIDPLIAKHGSSKPATENRARGNEGNLGKFLRGVQMAPRSASGEYFSAWPRSRGTSSGGSKMKKTIKLLYTKTLTYDDLLTSMLHLPNAVVIFFPKRYEGKHDRIKVPFKDYKGEVWDLEILKEGLSYNWDGFVKAHGLKYQDKISFYDEDINSKHYLICFARSPQKSPSN